MSITKVALFSLVNLASPDKRDVISAGKVNARADTRLINVNII